MLGACHDDGVSRPGPARPYDAYLRVYEPLEAFPAEARPHWRAYLSAQQSRDLAAAVVSARRESWTNLAATPPVLVPSTESEEAFLLLFEGRTLICPWETRLRSWLAFSDVDDALPPPVLEVALPPTARARAEAEQADLQASHVEVRPRILTSTWHVPLWWFVPFAPSERTLLERPDGSVELIYRTSMSQARRRVARGLRTLRERTDDVVAAAVENLGRWLEEFHPSAAVELDYGGLPVLLGAQRLREDTSAADVATGLAALAAGDDDSAVASYQRLVERWEAVQALEHAN